MAAGEAATSLVELWFHAGRRRRSGVRRADLARCGRQAAASPPADQPAAIRPDAGEAAPSLQQAAIAAEVGQELAGSRAALRELNLKPANTRGLAGVAALSRQVHSEVRQRPEFQRLMELVKQIEER